MQEWSKGNYQGQIKGITQVMPEINRLTASDLIAGIIIKKPVRESEKMKNIQLLILKKGVSYRD